MSRGLSKPPPRAASSPARLLRLFVAALSFTVLLSLVITLFRNGAGSVRPFRRAPTQEAPLEVEVESVKPLPDRKTAGDEKGRAKGPGPRRKKGPVAAAKKPATLNDAAETRSPPSLVLPGASHPASPPSLGSLLKSNPLAKSWTESLKDISSAVLRIIDHHPALETQEFKSRTQGIPGTGVETDEEAKQIQEWMDCEVSEGSWIWQPRGPARGGVTVHKQGRAEASCDRAHYKGREPRGTTLGLAESDDGWDVRPSLRYRWQSAGRCATLRPKHASTTSDISRKALCRQLRHKNILMVGDGAAAYSMHDLLLDWTNTKPATCYGDLYCKEHGLCGDELAEDWSGSAEDLEAGKFDETVYVSLPAPLAAGRRGPSKRAVVADDAAAGPPVNDLRLRDAEGDEEGVGRDDDGPDEAEAPIFVEEKGKAPVRAPKKKAEKPKTFGTIFRFRRSDGLWGSGSPGHSRFSPTWLHPNHGARETNNFWMADSRRTDVVILSKPPLPWPRPSHTDKMFERVAELAAHYAHLPDKVAKQARFEIHKHADEEAAVALIDLAKRMTLEVWLPEVLYTLISVRGDPAPADQLIIWRSEWRIQPDCAEGPSAVMASASGAKIATDDAFNWASWWSARGKGDGSPPRTHPPTLSELLFPDSRSDTGSDTPLGDVHTLFHNLQVIFQNQVLKKLLPGFGIPFLDMESPLAMWRSGMVGGAGASMSQAPLSSLVDQSGKGADATTKSRPSSTGKDCLRYCFPSPGGAVEHAFIGGLTRLFEAGWGGQRANTWMGDFFVPVRYRHDTAST